MDFDEFIDTYIDREIDYDKVSGVQCVDLIKLYLDNLFEIKAGSWGDAKDYFYSFEKRQALVENFEKIPYFQGFVPQKGDICVFGNGKYGHISLANGEGDTSEFTSIDQNWGSDKSIKYVSHSYSDLLGVLRPKNQSIITHQVIPEKPKAKLRYKVHIENIGWTDFIDEGNTAGTTGQGKKIEAILFKTNDGITLKARGHVQGKGWTDWKNAGEIVGTTGESRRLEAIEIQCNTRLEAFEHIQKIGDMPKSTGKNIFLGTVSKALRLEAITIKVL